MILGTYLKLYILVYYNTAIQSENIVSSQCDNFIMSPKNFITFIILLLY